MWVTLLGNLEMALTSPCSHYSSLPSGGAVGSGSVVLRVVRDESAAGTTFCIEAAAGATGFSVEAATGTTGVVFFVPMRSLVLISLFQE